VARDVNGESGPVSLAQPIALRSDTVTASQEFGICGTIQSDQSLPVFLREHTDPHSAGTIGL